MACSESMLENYVQWVLNTSQTLGWIIVFIVDVDVVMCNGVAYLLGKEIIVNEWFVVSEANFIIMPAGVSAFILAFSRVMSLFFALTILMKRHGS